jgi:hypothetical protein
MHSGYNKTKKQPIRHSREGGNPEAKTVIKVNGVRYTENRSYNNAK